MRLEITGISHTRNIPTQVQITKFLAQKFNYCDLLLTDAIFRQLVIEGHYPPFHGPITLVIHDLPTYLVLSQQISPISNTCANLERAIRKQLPHNSIVELGDCTVQQKFIADCLKRHAECLWIAPYAEPSALKFQIENRQRLGLWAKR